MSANILIINPKHPFQLVSPPLGIGYILAYNRKISNNSVTFLDENFIEQSDGEILKTIQEKNIEFIGISFPSVAILRVLAICKLIRTHFNNGITLFTGGYHPTSEPELTLRLIPYFDFLIIGEAEHIISKLDCNWRSSENIAYLNNNVFIQNPITYLKNIDEIPYPQRTDFNKRYFAPCFGAIAGIFGKVATIMSSRGCPYSCKFCSCKLIQKTVRFHSTEYVLSEIEHILSVTGKIDYLYFLDVMFLTKWGRVEELCSAFIRLGLHKHFKWAATVAANVVDDKKIKLMKEAGCFYLSFGFESNSEHVLEAINKKATPEHNKKACELCAKYNIYINSAFLFGIPGERAQDLQDTIDFVRAYNVHFTGVNIMMPLPGSAFYYDFVKQGIIRPSIDEWYTISSLSTTNKIYNDVLPKEQYDEYITKFYRTIKYRSKYFNLTANWRKRLKYCWSKSTVSNHG